MTPYAQLLSAPLVETLGWTLLHSLWQFALISMLVMCLLRALERASAAVRYGIVSLGMLAVVALPPLTFALGAASVETVETLAPVAAAAPRAEPPADSLPRPKVIPLEVPAEAWAETQIEASEFRPAAELPPVEATFPLQSAATGPLPLLTVWLGWTQSAVRPHLDWIVGAWLMGMLLFLARPLIACHSVRKLRRQGTAPVDAAIVQRMRGIADRLGIRRNVQIVQSTLVQVPAVIGVWRPLILLPASVLSGLTVDELAAIVAHELGHVKRHDYLVNMLQMAVETVFFYHPAVWWMSHQMRGLREDCCDDLALSVSGNRAEYARSLVALEELRGSVIPPMVAANGGSLLARVRRIVSGGHSRGSTATRGLWQLLPLASAVAVVIMLSLPQASESEAADSPKSSTRLTLLVADGEPAAVGTRMNLAQVGYTKDAAQLPTFTVGNKGRVKLDGLQQGVNHLVARATEFNVTHLELEMPSKEPRQVLRPDSLWTDENVRERLQVAVTVHGEGVEQRIEWKFDYKHATEEAPQYDLTPYDLQLVGSREMVRVIPAVDEGFYEGRFVQPGQEYSVHFNWIDLVQSGLWFSRSGEKFNEQEIPVDPGQAAFRAANGSPVILDAPEKMLKLIDHRRQATARLEFEQDSFFLGENLLTHYGLTNTGDRPLRIDWGGDYRGAERHLRLKVVAFDSDGQQVADPWPQQMCMGGLGNSPEIAPGGTYWMSLPLQRYCDIREPGTYEVKVYHDLGWDSGSVRPVEASNELPGEGHVAPIATGKITIRRPNERQARDVLRETFSLPREPWTTGSGQKSKPYADFKAMNFPIYVPLLKQQSQRWTPTEQDSDVYPPPPIEALGATPAPQATRALIDLLAEQEPKIAIAALDQLLKRLPYPHLGERTGWSGHWVRMQSLAEASWRAEFREELYDYALDVLQHGNSTKFDQNLDDDRRKNRIRAAKLLQGVARRENYDQLLGLHAELLQSIAGNEEELKAYPRPETLVHSLADALWYSLCDGNAKLPHTAEDVIYVTQRSHTRDPDTNYIYPAEYPEGAGVDPFSYMRLTKQYSGQFGRSDRVAQLISNPNPLIRAYTLEHLPTPIEESWHAPINQALRDPTGAYPPIAVAAFNVIQRDPDPRFIPAIRFRLEGETNQWVTPPGQQALAACEAVQQGRERAETEAARPWPAKVTGRIVYRSEQPGVRFFKGTGVNSDAGVSGEIVLPAGQVVGLADAIVSLRRPGDQEQGYFATGTKQVVIPAKGNRLFPRVVALQQGQELKFTNEESRHMGVSLSGSTRSGRRVADLQPGETAHFQPLAQGQPFEMNCANYSGLRGWVFVHTNPYFAVTDETGAFSIDNVPPGEWEIEIWHEKYTWIDKHRSPEKALLPIDSERVALGDIALVNSAPGNIEGLTTQTHADPWFWPDPYSHLGHVDSGGDGWRYLRIAGDAAVARENGIASEHQQEIAKLYRAAQEDLTGPSRDKQTVYTRFADQAREILTDKEHARVMQLFYQRMSYHALQRDEVAEKLDLSGQQRKEVEQAIQAHFVRLNERDAEIQAAIEGLDKTARGVLLRRQVDALKELTDSRGPYGRWSHKQVWNDFQRILSPSQRDLFNQLRGPMPASVRPSLPSFEGGPEPSAK